MSYRNHCNTLGVLSYTGGRSHLVADLVAAGTHTLEIWGSAVDGFEPYLVSDGAGVSLSSGRYSLRRDCVAACRRAYGEAIAIHRGRHWL